MKYMELNEGKAHGSAGFPLQYYAVDATHPQFRMPPHWHREFEIIRVNAGRFSAHLDNHPYPLSPGDCLFCAGGTVHRGEPENADCHYECVVFDPDLLRRARGTVIDAFLSPLVHRTRMVPPFFAAGDPAFSPVFDRIFDLATDPTPGAELALVGELYLLFSAVYREGRVEEAPAGLHQKAQSRTAAKLLDYIEEHLTEPLTLADLAAVSGLTARYLCRFFRAYTAMTPMQYLNERRVERACAELREGKSVTAAAFDCGFCDASYFSRVFRKYKGCSPAEYQKKQRDKP